MEKEDQRLFQPTNINENESGNRRKSARFEAIEEAAKSDTIVLKPRTSKVEPISYGLTLSETTRTVNIFILCGMTALGLGSLILGIALDDFSWRGISPLVIGLLLLLVSGYRWTQLYFGTVKADKNCIKINT